MATTNTSSYQIQGFHCSACANNLKASLSRLEGVIRVDADYDKATVELRFDPDRVTASDIRAQIRNSGFEPVEE